MTWHLTSGGYDGALACSPSTPIEPPRARRFATRIRTPGSWASTWPSARAPRTPRSAASLQLTAVRLRGLRSLVCDARIGREIGPEINGGARCAGASSHTGFRPGPTRTPSTGPPHCPRRRRGGRMRIPDHAEFRYTRVEGKAGYNSGVYVRNNKDGSLWHQAQIGDATGGYLFGLNPRRGWEEEVLQQSE